MENRVTHFELMYNLALLRVEKHITDESTYYIVHFSNEVPDITLQASRLEAGGYKWDTVPAGNTELAAAIGQLIEVYERS